MGLVFHCRYESCCVLLVATFLIINFSIFCFLHICMFEPDMFRQIFFPVGFSSPVNAPHGFLNNLLIPGDQTKKLRDVMAAYLFYRCEHLFC